MTPQQWRQIEDLYHAAQECRPAERAALLECTDPEVRLRLEQMLAVDPGIGMLDHPPADLLNSSSSPVERTGGQLGPYKIEAVIGAGGMGTVYRAVDTRLGRVVAIKIAAERYSVRFRLEARALSTLNHPHICTVYDVGPDYLVMEFIDGPTLAAEIKKGPLAPETAARYSAQIAGALAEAHSLGIVHRDLKPANVMVTRHGVKVLDFGLAKMLSVASITETDAVMGTPAYMAPEQVDRQEPTPAADLFALGLVLYEMVAGRLPFPGASLGQMLSKGAHPLMPVLSGEEAGVPSGLSSLVSKLLEKDPANRPQSASEVARELSSIADRIAAAPPRFRSRSRFALIAIAALTLLSGLGVWLNLRFKANDREPPIPGPDSFIQLTSFTDAAVDPVLSPDGRMVAFYRSGKAFGTGGDIWLKLLPDGEPVRLTHDSRLKYNIAFSPDSARIAYSVFPTVSKLFDTYTVSTLGGDSELFLPNSAGLSWLDDRHLLFSQIKSGVHMGIVTSNADRSGLREIYFPSFERGMAHYSHLSPNGKWILLEEMNPGWKPCRVVPFSGNSPGRQVGPPGATCTSAAWSRDGKYMYLGALVAGRYHLWRQRFPDGRPQQITFGASDELGAAVAPDGQSLITSIATNQNAVWIHDTRGDRAVSTEGYASSTIPVFSRDGKHLYYLLRRASPDAPAELWRADLDSGKSEVLVPGVSMQAFDISRDDERVLFSVQPTGRPSELWIAPLDRSAAPHQIAVGVDVPHFGLNGDVLFRMGVGGHELYIGAMREDGTGRRKALPGPILGFDNVSPDGRYIIADADVKNVVPPPMFAFPAGGGAAIRICDTLCNPIWSPGSRYLSLQIADESGKNPNSRTAFILLPPGKLLPRLTRELIHNPALWAKVPGVKVVNGVNIAPGPDPATYAYVKSSVHANLYRIPIR